MWAIVTTDPEWGYGVPSLSSLLDDGWRWSLKRPIALLLLLAAFVGGCGPSATELRERTLSVLNTEADLWDGGEKFTTTAADAYGQPLACHVKKTTLDYVLELRSNGPDGLPKNSDDLVVTRSRRHGQTTFAKEAAKAMEGVSSGATSGIIKGVKKGMGIGGKTE
jgi:hypothetical protein